MLPTIIRQEAWHPVVENCFFLHTTIFSRITPFLSTIKVVGMPENCRKSPQLFAVRQHKVLDS
jgi:hypothetical protein